MYTKSRNIIDLKKDDIVNDVFVVKAKNPVQEYARGFMFELKIGDSSRDMNYKYWGPSDVDKIKVLHDSINPGDVLFIQGKVGEWNNRLEITSNDASPPKVLKKIEYDVTDFLKKSSHDIEAMWAELADIVNSITNRDLKRIAEYFFTDEEFAEEFRNAPASMYIHHGWIGGVLEHTIAVSKICDVLCSLHENLDRDLLITGALLHNIGKIDEYHVTTSIKPTRDGMLLGHTVQSILYIEDAFEQLQITDEILKSKLLHMILTHTGAFGSNRRPAFPEAIALHHADSMDASITHALTIRHEARSDADFIYTKDFGQMYLS